MNLAALHGLFSSGDTMRPSLGRLTASAAVPGLVGVSAESGDSGDECRVKNDPR